LTKFKAGDRVKYILPPIGGAGGEFGKEFIIKEIIITNSGNFYISPRGNSVSEDYLELVEPEPFLEYIKGKAFHTKTKEDNIELLKIAHEHGLKWSTNKSYLDRNEYEWHKYNTCQYLEKGRYSDIHWYVNTNVQIVDAKEAINLYKTNKKEEKDEVFRKTEQCGRTESKGIRINRENIQVKSGSRPIGSRSTGLRRRSKIRKIEVEGRRIFFD